MATIGYTYSLLDHVFIRNYALYSASYMWPTLTLNILLQQRRSATDTAPACNGRGGRSGPRSKSQGLIFCVDLPDLPRKKIAVQTVKTNSVATNIFEQKLIFLNLTKGGVSFLNTVHSIISEKKHVITSSTISWTRTVRLQKFLAHLLLQCIPWPVACSRWGACLTDFRFQILGTNDP